MVYILMTSKREEIYRRMLQELTDFGEENTIVLKPRAVLTDLELAAINASKSEFPEVVNKVCFFFILVSVYGGKYKLVVFHPVTGQTKT